MIYGGGPTVVPADPERWAWARSAASRCTGRLTLDGLGDSVEGWAEGLRSVVAAFNPLLRELELPEFDFNWSRQWPAPARSGKSAAELLLEILAGAPPPVKEVAVQVRSIHDPEPAWVAPGAAAAGRPTVEVVASSYSFSLRAARCT